jgi:tetratricopeptide (TPR) repeat protein
MPRCSVQTNKKILFRASLLWSIVFVLITSTNVSAHDGLHEQIIAVTKEIAKEPNNANLYLKRAELYRLHEEWKNSEKDFDRAEKLNSNLAVVDLGRGKLWLDSKRFSSAKLALEKFLSKEPQSFEGVITIARVSAKLKQPENAVKYFTQAILLSPKDSAEIYLERSQTLAEAGKIDEAMRGLDEGIERFGGLVVLQNYAIDLEVKRKRYDAALARLDRLAETMPRKESFLLKRGEILLKAGKKCEARKAFAESLNTIEALSDFRKNVHAIQTMKTHLQNLLKQTTSKNCE